MRTMHRRRGIRAPAALGGLAMLPLLWVPFASGFAGSPAWGVFGGSGRSPAREPLTRGARVEGLQGRRAARIPHAAGALRRAWGAGWSAQTGVVGDPRVLSQLMVWPGFCPLCSSAGGCASRPARACARKNLCMCACPVCTRPDCGRSSHGA